MLTYLNMLLNIKTLLIPLDLAYNSLFLQNSLRAEEDCIYIFPTSDIRSKTSCNMHFHYCTLTGSIKPSLEYFHILSCSVTAHNMYSIISRMNYNDNISISNKRGVCELYDTISNNCSITTKISLLLLGLGL